MHYKAVSHHRLLNSERRIGPPFRRSISALKHLFCLSLLLFLAACGSTTTGYVSPADIKPVYVMRNSPRYPAPLPKMRPYRAAAKATKATSRPVRYVAHASVKTVTVRRGDTLYSLSRRYGVQVRDLAQVNRIRPPYGLSVGQKLKLPSQSSHTVKKGETTYAIAQRYQVRLSDLIKINRIRPPYALSIGEKLKLPGGAVRTAQPTPIRRAAAKRPVKKWQPRQKPAPARTYTPPPKTGTYFAWPISGTIISRFGPKKGGIHNDGINMVARKGTAIRAAEAGVVAYASNDLPGYGNLILVKHSGNWVTAYAHTENINVKPGQVVKKGQMLARVGQTGGVVRPQLHFEIRRGRKALNPLLYLERNPQGRAR